MQMTKISITYQETANLGNYSNVKPSVTLEAVLESTDDPADVMLYLMAQARDLVQVQVDDALESQGDPAKYSTDPRFDLVSHNSGTLTIIVPHGTKLPTKRAYTATRNHRLAAIRQIAADREDRRDTERRLIDCSDGDLTPALEAIAPLDAELDEEERKRKEEQERQMAEYQKQQEERRRQYEQQYGSADEDDDEEGDEGDEEL